MDTKSAPPKKIIYVNYCDSINETKVKAIMSVLSDVINREKPDVIYCLFSSSGGQIDVGVALYNFLRSLPVEIIMHNTGSIDSVAIVVFLAADVRYASVHSSFLFHGATWNFPANSSANRNQLAEIQSNFNASEAKMAGIIMERTNLTIEEVQVLFNRGESKNPDYAISKNIIGQIINPEIPKGVNILSFNLTP